LAVATTSGFETGFASPFPASATFFGFAGFGGLMIVNSGCVSSKPAGLAGFFDSCGGTDFTAAGFSAPGCLPESGFDASDFRVGTGLGDCAFAESDFRV
jgi:hypothetical protein